MSGDARAFITSVILLTATLCADCVVALEIVAHRANGCGLTENSLAAIEKSWQLGVDAVEVDVRLSKDDVLYLFHDEEIRNKAVRRLTYAQSVERAGDVPTLDAVLELGPQSGYYILDLKGRPGELREPLNEIIERTGFPAGRLAFQSDNLDLLAGLKRDFPASKFYFRTALKRKKLSFKKPDPRVMAETLRQADVDAVSIKGRSFVDEKFLGHFHAAGLRVFVWTINKPNRATHYKELGVDGIITDNVLGVRSAAGLATVTKDGCRLAKHGDGADRDRS